MVEVDKALELILSKTFRKPARVMAVNYGNEWHMQLHTHLSIVHYYFCDLGIVGYVIAEDVYASIALPPFPASVKDGYAVVGEWVTTLEEKYISMREGVRYISSILFSFWWSWWEEGGGTCCSWRESKLH